MSGSPRDPARIAGYVGSLTTFGSAIALASVLGRRKGQSLPERYDVLDLVLGAVATHKMARVIAKEGVTTPIRAPFTDHEEAIGSAEVHDTPKDGHVSHVVGELLTCPFCLGPWIASAYVGTLAVSPPLARAWAAVFSIVGGSDFLQHAYGRVRTD